MLILVLFIFLLSAIFFPQITFAQIPSGVGIGFDQILNLISNLGNYFYTAAFIFAGITFVWAGILFVIAGDDTSKAKKGKDVFKSGIIGTIILSGIGTFIMTTQLIAGGGPFWFFGFGSPDVAGDPGPQLSTYGCNAQNACVQMVGGLFPDSSCSDYCDVSPGPSAQSTQACLQCVNVGWAYCLADMNTVADPCYQLETDCQGVFTRVAGGCP